MRRAWAWYCLQESGGLSADGPRLFRTVVRSIPFDDFPNLMADDAIALEMRAKSAQESIAPGVQGLGLQPGYLCHPGNRESAHKPELENASVLCLQCRKRAGKAGSRAAGNRGKLSP